MTPIHDWGGGRLLSPSTLTVTPATVTLAAAATQQLTGVVTNAASQELWGPAFAVSYTSDDTDIATVSATGLVTAVATGSATITGTTAQGLSDTCIVTVSA